MHKATAKATKCNSGLQHARLTVAQENAVDALASGKNDGETASLVGVHRVTVTRWRLYSPHFQAALNVRRQAIWAVGLDRLRSLVPTALDALADELRPDSSNRVQAALGLLKLIPLSSAVPAGPTDADEIVRGIVDARRTNTRGPLDDTLDMAGGKNSYAEDVRRTWDDLAAHLERVDSDPLAEAKPEKLEGK